MRVHIEKRGYSESAGQNIYDMTLRYRGQELFVEGANEDDLLTFGSRFKEAIETILEDLKD